MLDDGALRARGAQHRLGAVRVHHAAQALRPRLTARRIDLLLRQGRHAAVADAGRREDLDQVGAVALQLADLFANLIGRPFRIRNLAERRQDARSRQHAAIDRIAQRLVGRRADALHGGEAVDQRDVGVFGAIQRRLVGRFRPGVIAALVVEVPADVHVRVDEAGQQREVAQVDRRRSARRSNADDLAVLDRHVRVADACRRGHRSPAAPGSSCPDRLVAQPTADARRDECDELTRVLFIP